MEISESVDGNLTGRMNVPNDFDADLENLSASGSTLNFEVLVPKNSSRPVDLVFRYEGQQFVPGASQVTGFVRLVKSDGKPQEARPYVATFLMFRK